MKLNDVTVIMKCIENSHVIFNCFQWSSFVQLWNLPTNYDLDNDETYFISVCRLIWTANSRSLSSLRRKISSKKYSISIVKPFQRRSIYKQIHNDSLINHGSSTNNTATSIQLITLALILFHFTTKQKTNSCRKHKIISICIYLARLL